LFSLNANTGKPLRSLPLHCGACAIETAGTWLVSRQCQSDTTRRKREKHLLLLKDAGRQAVFTPPSATLKPVEGMTLSFLLLRLLPLADKSQRVDIQYCA